MGYKVIGTLKHDDDVFDHGESVSAGDVGGKENFEQLKAAKAVVSDEEFDRLYPEQDGEVIDAPGTPSNLREVEGTKLEAKAPENDGSKSDSSGQKNSGSSNQTTQSGDKSGDAAKAQGQQK